MAEIGFHEVRFPLVLAFGSAGGPERRTDIVTLASGFEARNSRWADSRRRYDAGTGVRSVADIHTLITFFEERRGRLHGFLWRDPTDWKSCAPHEAPRPNDQRIGEGNGVTTDFPLVKTYGGDFEPFRRAITKPVARSVRVAVDGVERVRGEDFHVSARTGIVSFLPHAVPPEGSVVKAGYEFDVPVRFDTDVLSISLAAFEAGEIPSIPIVEIRT